ncbi:MAG: SusD/RagB family nutrient-binding outer membrane lipoprotein [Bacteroidota bacterium]
MKKIIYLITVLLIAGSCDDYLDVNTDPNNPTEVSPELILPVGQNYTARWMLTDRSVSHLGNMMMYNWSEAAGFSWYNDEFQYIANSPTFYDNIFNIAYTDAMKQYEELRNLGDDFLAYKAIATIMQCYTYQILVDLYGDIPFQEALQRGGNATPAYDAAESVYDSLVVRLTNSIADLTVVEGIATASVPTTDDIIYGGDLDSWKKLANTIKLRLLTRASDVKSSTYITEQIAIIDAEGSGYITEDFTVNPGYLNEADKQSPLFEDFGADETGAPTLSGDATCATDFILQLLDDTNDPRISRLYEEPATGHLGVPQGVTVAVEQFGADLVSNIGPGLLDGSTQDALLMSVAEVQFNLAELALKGLVSGDPETFYEAGVTASFVTLGLPAADASTYLGQSINNVSYGASSDKLEAIITQKWLASNGICAEQSWFDWVRTGFPLNLPVSVETPNLVRPVRLSYPASELGTNSNNVPDQPDVYTTPTFWAN